MKRKMGTYSSTGAEVPVSRLQEVADSLHLDEEALALSCGLSRSTYYRRKQSKKRLSATEADLLERHARIYAQACDTFESGAAATAWLKTPQYGLGGEIPLDAIRTTPGFREVERLLTRIDFGVYA